MKTNTTIAVMQLKLEKLFNLCTIKSCKITTIESCTGGLLAGCITSMDGSSAIFEYGFVTYSNKAKTKLVDVPAEMLLQYGAVSEEVAAAMAEGGAKNSGSDLAISITGIAGPDGGSEQKPVGLVYICCLYEGISIVQKFNFKGDRNSVRQQTLEAALDMAIDALEG